MPLLRIIPPIYIEMKTSPTLTKANLLVLLSPPRTKKLMNILLIKIITITDVFKELKSPLSRIGVSPIAVTNGSLYATGHQLRNHTYLEREDDRSSQATNVRGKESSESSADLGRQQTGRERSGQLGNQTTTRDHLA
jgi:hypothetical protein